MNHPIVPPATTGWPNASALLAQREGTDPACEDRVAAAAPRPALGAPRRRTTCFDTPAGPRRLAELFQGRRQLLVQHFMFGPGWEQGCKSCSFMADHLDAMAPHLAQRDIALLVVSRAPLAQIEPFRAAHGLAASTWASSHGSDVQPATSTSASGPQDRVDGAVFYNYEMTALPGRTRRRASASSARTTAGEVFHTYATFGRGVEVMMGTYGLIDLTPRGRDEGRARPTRWPGVRHHDRYEPDRHASAAPASCCGAKA